MSEAEPPKPSEPNVAWAKKRLPFEQTPSKLAGNRGKLFLFAAITLACAAAAGYGALVAHYPITDMRVIAPGVGALWFALRIFMLTTPRV
ncbi:MAG TPA: hypothetical protein VG943_00865 [Caulobacterales bacterium]|nr:hypothetical protein [Caulobacterales bacterium]